MAAANFAEQRIVLKTLSLHLRQCLHRNCIIQELGNRIRFEAKLPRVDRYGGQPPVLYFISYTLRNLLSG